MICYHNVLVSTPGSNWNASTIISIQLKYWLISNMYIFCFDGRRNILHPLFFWCNLEDYLFMILDGGIFFLVDRTPWEDWTMCPLIVSTARWQYLATLEYVSPGHVSKFPLYITLSHVDLTGNRDATCMYCTSASALGISYTLYA